MHLDKCEVYRIKLEVYRIREQSEGNQIKRAIRGWSECGIVTRLPLTSDRLLVLKHPLLLSIIYIIESGLEELLRLAASAVCSARRKSDCLSCTSHIFIICRSHHLFHSYICNLSLILTSALIHQLPSLTHSCSTVVPFYLNFSYMKHSLMFYICNPIIHLHLKNLSPYMCKKIYFLSFENCIHYLHLSSFHM